MKKLVSVLVQIEVLQAQVKVFVGDEKKAIKALKKEKLIIGRRGALATTWFRREKEEILPFRVVIHSKTAAMSVIAHEAVHASSFILDAIGVVADWNNDELQAYIVQLICNKVEETLYPNL